MTQFYEQVEYIVVAVTLAIALYLIIASAVTFLLEGGDVNTERFEVQSQNTLVMENLLTVQDETPRAVFTEDYILNEDNIRTNNGNCYIPEVEGLDGDRIALGFFRYEGTDSIVEDYQVFEDCKTETSAFDPSARTISTVYTEEDSVEFGVVVYRVE